MRLESVFMGNDRELLPQMFAFYAPLASVVRDVTANNRKMWNGVHVPFTPKFYDIDPTMSPDEVCSWDNVPDASESVDVLVYDPPHLPLAAASEMSNSGMTVMYGLGRSVKADNIAEMFPPFLRESARVLRPDGLIFAKIKDYVHNHKYQWNSHLFVSAVIDAGLTPCDMIVKRDPCGGNLKSGRWIRSHHVRNVHCNWIVVRKGRCEAHKSWFGQQSTPDQTNNQNSLF